MHKKSEKKSLANAVASKKPVVKKTKKSKKC